MDTNRHRVLVVAAHPDDEVLGAGGTIVKHSRAGDEVWVVILTEGASVQFPNEPVKIALKSDQARRAGELLGVKEILEGEFPDQRLDTLPIIEVAQFIEHAVRELQPQTIYTHHYSELNRDHRIAYEATTVAVRPIGLRSFERLLCFSVDSLTQWGAGTPLYNIYCDISETLETKIEAMKIYDTEIRPYPHPRSLEAIRSTAKRNGSIVGLKSAEIFQSVLEVRK